MTHLPTRSRTPRLLALTGAAAAVALALAGCGSTDPAERRREAATFPRGAQVR